MNKLWNLQNYSAEALHRTVARDGLHIRIHPQVHPFLRREYRLPWSSKSLQGLQYAALLPHFQLP